MAGKSCGEHVELERNAAVRVTRCPCGTVHVTLFASGVTVRMTTESLRGVAGGLRGALDKLDESPHLGRVTIN
ncbi:MAG: hypothetical protein WKG00_37860 [Polyangiaceae bacterium]